MAHYVVISLPDPPPAKAASQLLEAAACVRNYRVAASCQLIARDGLAAALLIMGTKPVLDTVCHKLSSVFTRWRKPNMLVETGSAAGRWLGHAPLPGERGTARQHLLAALYHEQWRQDYAHQSGGRERMKKTTDVDWSQRHAGATEVDIAGTAFEDLPVDWRSENLAAAAAVLDFVDAAAACGDALDQAFVERAAAEAHAKWLERNGAYAPPEQQVEFAGLSAAEQHKDRVQVWLALFLEDAWPAAPL